MQQITQGLNHLIEGKRPTASMVEKIMKEIMSGKAHDVQIGAFLTALRIRGENAEVISAAASVMREFSNKIHPRYDNLVDTCGTGGDGKGTFNISTLAGVVAAGAGVPVAKHGNRAVSSHCGSADLLEGFGAKIDIEPKEVERVINEVGFGFMFAPKFHPAMKYAMPARRALAIRTIFNILGPLTNPASAQYQVMGVFDKKIMRTIAEALDKLGVKHAYVVHSDPGVDEIVPISKVYITELKDGNISEKIYGPKDLGLRKVTLKDVKGGSLEENIKIASQILQHSGEQLKEQIVAANAAFAILASGLETDYESALKRAQQSIESGAALKKLEEFVKATGGNLDTFNSKVN